MKKSSLVSLAIAFPLMLSGCMPKSGNGENGNYTINLDVPYDIKAELVIGVSADPIETDMVRSLGEAFTEIYENVTITPKTIQGQSYSAALMGLYGSGGMPDIMFSDSTDNSKFIDKGILLNLDKYVEAEVELDADWLGQYYENMWDLGKEKHKESLYMVPRSADRVVAHYNKEVLRTAGVDMSLVKNGWTWDDFLTVMKQVREHFDQTGRENQYLLDSYMNWEPIINSILASFGVQIFEGEKLSINSAETKAALALMHELVDLRIIAPMNSQASANYEGGQGAMLFHSAPASKYKKLLGEDYDLVTFPLIGQGEGSQKDYSNAKIGCGIPGYAIFSETENRDLAWKFLSFMLTQEGQNALAKGGSTCLPIRRDMADSTQNAWGVGLESVNLEAYSWETERNVATDFHLIWDSRYHSDLLSALSDMVYVHLSTPGLSAANAIAKFTEDCNDILGI